MLCEFVSRWWRPGVWALIGVGSSLVLSACSSKGNTSMSSGAGSTEVIDRAEHAGAMTPGAGGPTTLPSGTFTMAFPTGDRTSSVLLLEKIQPQEVRVNQPYSYQLRVTNLTNQTLNGVTINE